MMDDLISRQAAINVVGVNTWAGSRISKLPTAEPTLYGYKIEHLAYIATVMEKEGVTAEYAVRTFDDIERVIKMVIEETRAKIEEAFNG